MTKLKTILVALMATMTMAMAGGNIAPVQTIEVAPVAKDFYIGVNTSIGESITSNDFRTFETTSVGIDAGYVFYRNGAFSTAVEGRYTTIMGSYSDFGDVYTVAGFLKPQYNFGDFGVYALAGYSYVDNGVLDADGFAYGVGASYAIADSYEIFVDYVANDSTDLGDFNLDNAQNEIVSVGVNYKF